MKHVLENVNVKYVGGDIVVNKINDLNNTFRSESISFIHFDLINNIPQRSDLFICRDLLFRFSYEDTFVVLKNYCNSQIHFILTTTHHKKRLLLNHDNIFSGYRQIGLLSAPYDFSIEAIYSIDDYVDSDSKRFQKLWSREQISAVVHNFY
jgi:predicted nicotinamide N-methyase